MILKANIKEAVTSLYGAKQRTILALIGIIIGIGSVIAMVSIGTIVQNESLKQFKDMGTDILTIRKGFSRGGKGTVKKTIKIEDAIGIPLACPSISNVAPYIEAHLQMRQSGKIDHCPVKGVTESFQSLNKIRIREGRFISDLDSFSYFCVLGEERAAKLRSSGMLQPIGKKVKAGDHIFTVVGVMEKVPRGGMRPFGINEGMLVPIQTASRIVEKAEVNNIVARMLPGVHYTAAQSELSGYFSKKANAPQIKVYSAEELIERMEKQMKLFTLLLGAVGSISLIVGGVGVMNVMLVSVAERRKEIGIRRALGAKRGDIQTQFLLESIILSMIGGAFGIALGITASYIISHFSKWQFLISYMAILLGVGVSSAVGVFFGFYPARQAARLDPIAALRSE